MKTHLFFVLTLTIALKAYTQTNSGYSKPSSKTNRTEAFIQQLKWKENISNVSYQGSIDSNLILKEAATTTSINWSLLCGSMNVYGMLVNQTRPLQFHPQLNTVSFIHRKSESYTPYPASNSSPGTIVAEISNNWGQTWDSTCIWADATNGGRYPQGAIYNPPLNTNMTNAYVVGCGPVVSNNAFTGNWYASKQLGLPASAAYNPTPSTVTGAQQFLSFSLTSYPINQAPHGWSMQGFTAFDGGPVRSMALIDDDNTDPNTMRGVMMVKGTFNAGVFVWTTDSIIPDVIVQSSGDRQFSTKVQMAWNETGTIGYAVIIGALNSSSRSNRGLQPIIYKSSNSGQSWNPCPIIDFNSPTFARILDPLGGVETDSTLKIPFVDDFDLAVDKNNCLHIGAILGSTFSDKDDSLQFIAQFTTSINPNDEYKWKHTPGNRPYLYDFIGDGSQAWKYLLIDSLSSEGPGTLSGTSGFVENPWDVDAGFKIPMDSRLQMGRTPNGEYITFSWAESDSNFVSQFKKWNIQPDIKARAIAITSTITSGNGSTFCMVSNNELNVTSPSTLQGVQHPKVVNRATLHFMSPVTSSAVTTNSSVPGFPVGCRFTANIKVPFTVTNSQPYSQLTNNSTWFSASDLDFTFIICRNDIKEMNNENNNVTVFPNPANKTTHLNFISKQSVSGFLYMNNLIGQTISSTAIEAVSGENNLEIDLKNLPSGIYFVNVKLGEQSFTKKLVIE